MYTLKMTIYKVLKDFCPKTLGGGRGGGGWKEGGRGGGKRRGKEGGGGILGELLPRYKTLILCFCQDYKFART